MASKTEKTPRWTPLSAAQAKEAAQVARPALAPCLCGCGTMTKGRFAPGHDAIHHARLDATVKAGGPAAKHAQAALDAFGWTRPEPKVKTTEA